MKYLSAFWIIVVVLGSSCNKDEDNTTLPPVSASGLATGKAGVRFTTNKNFRGSRSFELINTDLTISSDQVLGEARNIRLEFIDLDINRSASIEIMLSRTHSTNGGPIQIDLAVPFFTMSAVPRSLVRLQELAAFGSYFNTVYDSRLGYISISKLTNTEIEGSFGAQVSTSSGNAVDLSNGSFAGKFP